MSLDKLYILQDSDVDGVVSASILYQYLKLLEPTIEIITLYQADKKHGIHKDNVDLISPNSLLIIPDASINSQEYADKLYGKNVKIIEVDHHETEPLKHVISINAKHSPNVENKCGSGGLTVHKFLQYMDKQLSVKYSKQFVDLVALSIISDSCDVSSLENRTYLYWGLNHIVNPFYRYLCKQCIKDFDDCVTPKDLSFCVINLLNAVQRGSNQELKEAIFKCFVGEQDNFDYVLSECKKEKKYQDDKVKEIVATVCDDIDELKPIAMGFCDDMEGYSGLICNKLVSKFNKPVFMLRKENDNYTGSCRSPIEVKDLFNESRLFNYASGHNSSMGVSFPIKNYDSIMEYFTQNPLEDATEYKVIGSYVPAKIPHDLYTLATDYSQLWSQGLSIPLVHIRSIKIKGTDIQEIGNGSTIKFKIGNVTFIQFFCTKEYKQSIHVGEKINLNIELLGVAQYNNWNGNQHPQIVIEKLECSTVNKKDFENLW